MPDDSPPTTRSARFAVFGFYGNENLGDEAIVEAVIENIRELIPSAEMTCISVNPVDSRQRHEVQADSIFLPAAQYSSVRQRLEQKKLAAAAGKEVSKDDLATSSLRSRLKRLPLLPQFVSAIRGLIKLPTALRRQFRFAQHIRQVVGRTDAILVSGSNQFLDNFGGAWRFPLTLWLWTYFAKRENVPVVVMSVGAGPISSRLSMRLIQGTIRRTGYISLRDTGSAALVGLDRKPGIVRPDLAFSHRSEIVDSALNRNFVLDRPPVIGINPMAVYARGYWYEVDDDKYNGIVTKLSQIVRKLEQSNQGFVFIANQPSDEPVINDVIDMAVANGSSRRDLESRFHMSTTVDEYLHNVSKVDIMIATRFHANVLGLLLARPIIGLCYHKKSAELLRNFSLGDHAYDLDKFEVGQVVDSIETITKDYEAIARSIADRARDYRSQLLTQYETVRKVIAPRI